MVVKSWFTMMVEMQITFNKSIQVIREVLFTLNHPQSCSDDVITPVIQSLFAKLNQLPSANLHPTPLHLRKTNGWNPKNHQFEQGKTSVSPNLHDFGFPAVQFRGVFSPSCFFDRFERWPCWARARVVLLMPGTSKEQPDKRNLLFSWIYLKFRKKPFTNLQPWFCIGFVGVIIITL